MIAAYGYNSPSIRDTIYAIKDVGVESFCNVPPEYLAMGLIIASLIAGGGVEQKDPSQIAYYRLHDVP